ncbi:hypothetical protein DO97_17525 [Neosynechococcus sphagnicola sy1]|uniref:Uncharacterized protein n=1 Tax=Neosynechococcus sphagnicola sy1 TaxID=1497020 RepID=A0A098THS3_9CYAN|nr:hypothetical protein [Neosynechococcus sphagnicola]KGF71566.1 hypothetical protein DO97_17525 [Neosynechococcus sphagnicola sy1]
MTETLIEFITNLDTADLERLTAVLEAWDGSGDDLIDTAQQYAALLLADRAVSDSGRPSA